MSVSDLSTWVGVVAGVATAVGVFVAIFQAIAEWRRSTNQRVEELKQRQREFRHKQATFARELTREVFADPKARAALKMMDWLNARYLAENGTPYTIQRDEVQPALRMNNLHFTDKETFIRLCFEALYDYLEQIEHLIELEVINFDNIETVFRYYILRILRPDIRHFEFLDFYDYPRATKFLRRFESKQNK
jgi:hypothetical protein